MPASIQFCGAARHVTGANYLLDFGFKKVLVDCGMFQGCHFCEGRNFNQFPYDPKDIDAAFITHAHIDHTGRIPKLVERGFKGKIFSTAPTKEFAELLLRDSLHILEEEARGKNRDVLYSPADVEKALRQWEDVAYDATVDVGGGVSVTMRNAGHILGSSMYEVTYPASGGTKKISFTGDLGNPPSPFLHPPDRIDRTDYLVIEAAYGDRLHKDIADRKILLERAVEDAARRGGTLMIPAFAMERTQELLYELNDLVEEKRVPQIPVFVDSPLAIKITGVYKKYSQFFGEEARDRMRHDDIFKFPGLRFTIKKEESMAINDVPPPKVIIAGSGMSNGGRILHHERRYLPDKNSILLMTGYQVAGSPGRLLQDGAREIKMFGEMLPVRAEVRAISGYSAHADQEQLYDFVSHIAKPIERMFAVQGEENATLTLVQMVRDKLGIDAKAPMWKDVYSI